MQRQKKGKDRSLLLSGIKMKIINKVYMKKSLLILTALLSMHLLYGQNARSESIRNSLAIAKSDSAKLSIIGKWIWITTWSDPEYALELAKQQLLLTKKAVPSKAEASALAHYATILSVLGDYSHAIDYHLQAIKLHEQLKDTAELQLAYLNISEAYSDAGDYDNAIEYAYKGKSIINRVNKEDTAVILRRMLTWTYIGEAYEKFGKLDSAFFYLKKARAIDSTYFNSQSGFTTLHLAGTYAKRNQLAEATKYYRQAIDISRIHDYKSDLMDACNGLAKVFNQTGQTDSAIFYANQTVLIGNNTAYPLAILNAVTILSHIYKSKNNLDSAVKYMGLSILIKDSLFNREKVRQVQDISFSEHLRQQELQQKIEQNKVYYKNRLNIYILLAGLLILLIVAGGLWRRNVYKQRSFAILQKQKQEIDIQKQKVESTLSELKATQNQLIQSEKMASLGELTAGIAHEIQNPLNFVNNFSDVNAELLDELDQEADKGNIEEIKAIAKNIKDNEHKINHHGKRADAIVKGMLQHARTSSGQKEPVDVNALADEYLRLAYYGLKAKDKVFSAVPIAIGIKTDFDSSIGKINIIPQDISRVIFNLINNAFYAVNEKAKENVSGYEPTVSVGTKKMNGKVEIKVGDNGNGIPKEIVDKIFQPFFTTKPTGQGTGLGLSLAYDIVKAHGGEIKVETKEGEGSSFTIILSS